MVNIDKIKETYPLHWLVWNNEHIQLDKVLSSNEVRLLLKYCKNLNFNFSILHLYTYINEYTKVMKKLRRIEKPYNIIIVNSI